MILQSIKDLKNKAFRIVSLVPSQTELLHFLGLEAETIGITKFCVHPKNWMQTKQIIGGTKNINVDQIKKLQPDLIIANKEENVKDQVLSLAKEFPVWVTDVNNLEDALQMIIDIGYLTDKITKANELVESINNNFSALKTLTHNTPTAYLIWRNPYMTIGGDTFIHDMLNRCGLHNIFSEKKRYPAVTIAEIKDAGCKLLLLSTEPYPFKQQHISELQLLLPTTKIILVDGEMFSWYGSRLLHSADYFKHLLREINAYNSGLKK